MVFLIEALLHFLFEIVQKIAGEIIVAVISDLPVLLSSIAERSNIETQISFFDEITKLDLFD